MVSFGWGSGVFGTTRQCQDAKAKKVNNAMCANNNLPLVRRCAELAALSH